MPSPISDLELRHLLAQISDREGLESHLQQSGRSLYCGFDPTAPSLHIGNLVPLLTLRRFQLAGHSPIALVGGATGLIGDPSGRVDERGLNDVDVVRGWGERLSQQVSRFIDLDGTYAARVVDNLEWTSPLDALGFLRDIGKHFSVNAMMQRDSVKNRLGREGDGISYTEFSYMLLQAYDFLELSRRYQCTIQVGGSDQWGNMISGIDLIRRVDGQQAFVLTVPLITRSDGLKFGKTADGAIWLDPDMTSPYRFYQFWLNSADEDVVPFLGYFTFLDSSVIADAATELRDRPGERAAQRLLAREVTLLAHGQRALSSAQRITAALFGGAVADLKHEDLQQLQLDGMDSTSVENEEELLTALVRAGLAKSRGAGRKLIDGKGVQINGELVELPSKALRLERALFGRYHLLRRGKKSWHMFFHE